MTITLEFSCKDPLIAEYCEREFREKFELMVGHESIRGRTREKMKAMLSREAERQEWYEYVEIPGMKPGTTRRVPVMEDGKPKLLIPEIEIIIKDSL